MWSTMILTRECLPFAPSLSSLSSLSFSFERRPCTDFDLLSLDDDDDLSSSSCSLFSSSSSGLDEESKPTDRDLPSRL
mgnify:CR=1 FL=1